MTEPTPSDFCMYLIHIIEEMHGNFYGILCCGFLGMTNLLSNSLLFSQQKIRKLLSLLGGIWKPTWGFWVDNTRKNLVDKAELG
jgi:hypothetical protein